ncbi:MAG: PPC domain-containing DNA-binding protein [Halanaerobiales bacterium]
MIIIITGFGKIKETLIVSLDKGEDVLASLEEAIKDNNIKNGLILTGYGTLDKSTLHMITTTGFPAENYFDKKEQPLEVISLDGVIADGELHAHITLSDTERAYGGHLEPGCRTLYLFEIVIGILDDIDLVREKDEHDINKLKIK